MLDPPVGVVAEENNEDQNITVTWNEPGSFIYYNVTCDGGGGALGHPKIYLDMGRGKKIVCPYCSKLFVLENNN